MCRCIDHSPSASIPLLVFQDGVRLRVAISPDWGHGLLPLDREYLTELMLDWSRLGPDEIIATLEQLKELSIGPLRVIQSGIADRKRLSVMMQRLETCSFVAS